MTARGRRPQAKSTTAPASMPKTVNIGPVMAACPSPKRGHPSGSPCTTPSLRTSLELLPPSEWADNVLSMSIFDKIDLTQEVLF